VGVANVRGFLVHKQRQGSWGNKSTYTLRYNAIPEALPPDQDVAAAQRVAELHQAITGELRDRAQLVQNAAPTALCGPTAFKMRDLTLLPPRAAGELP